MTNTVVDNHQKQSKLFSLQVIINAYGQTEMGLVCMGLTSKHLGVVMPACRLKIEDPETGERCGPGEVGEICAKNNFGMMQRYLNRPKDTKYCLNFIF